MRFKLALEGPADPDLDSSGSSHLVWRPLSWQCRVGQQLIRSGQLSLPGGYWDTVGEADLDLQSGSLPPWGSLCAVHLSTGRRRGHRAH